MTMLGRRRAGLRIRAHPMSGNTLGKLFCVTSFGESHGPAIGCVVDGCPPGLALAEADIQRELDRRKPGTSRHVTQRRESDTVEILSGVFEGRTTGTPIALLIRNDDQRSKDYSKIAETVPSRARRLHLLAEVRHPRLPRRRAAVGARDRGAGRRRRDRQEMAARALRRRRPRLPERSSARSRFRSGPGTRSHANPFFAADADIVPQLEAFMDELRKSGDSCRRDDHDRGRGRAGRLGRAGVRQARRRHRLHHDEHQRGEGRRDRRGFRQRDAERHRARRRDDARRDFSRTTPAAFSAASRPGRTSSCASRSSPLRASGLPRRSIDKQGQPVRVETHGRHDPCVGIRATPIAEAMLAIVLMDHALRHRAQNADVVCATPRIAARAPGSPARVRRHARGREPGSGRSLGACSADARLPGPQPTPP